MQSLDYMQYLEMIVSAFFRKGKKTFWRVACKNGKFLSALSSLGTAYEVDKDLEETLENFICAIYGKSKLKDVNLACAAIFWDRYNKQKKIIDLCMLPPCKGNLKLQWNGTTAEAEWMMTLAPQDIADLLIDLEETDDDFDELYEPEEEVMQNGDCEDEDIELEDFFVNLLSHKMFCCTHTCIYCLIDL